MPLWTHTENYTRDVIERQDHVTRGEPRQRDVTDLCGHTRGADVLGLRRLDNSTRGRIHQRTVGDRADERLASPPDYLCPVPTDDQRTGRAHHVQRRLGHRRFRLLRRRTRPRCVAFFVPSSHTAALTDRGGPLGEQSSTFSE